MQDVIHVDHTYTAEDMMRAGRDVEKNVLSRALYKVLVQRVFVYGNLNDYSLIASKNNLVTFNPLRMKITQPVRFSQRNTLQRCVI